MSDWVLAYKEAFATPFNVFLLLLMFVMLIFWFSANKWQTPERVRRRAIFFSPRATQILQGKFRNKYLDFLTQQVWFWAFIVSVVIEVFICGLQGKDAWRYGILVIPAWATSMAIQFIFPVIVPIRWDKFGRELPVVPIRLQQFKQSDNVNGLLYNGLPSNHLGMMLAGVLLALFMAPHDSLGPEPWYILALFFLLLAVFFCFAVIYLGEHYIQDLIASVLVYPPIMIVIKIFVDINFPMT
ncbi:MAG: phosphatase PAP2 family protein [Candidatus Hodarchaeales archaeon]